MFSCLPFWTSGSLWFSVWLYFSQYMTSKIHTPAYHTHTHFIGEKKCPWGILITFYSLPSVNIILHKFFISVSFLIYRNIAKVVHKIPIYPSPSWVSSNVTTLLLHLSKAGNQYLVNSGHDSDFTRFFTDVLFLSQDSIQGTSLHLILTFPWFSLVCENFCFCLEWPWQVWGVPVRYFVDHPTIQVCLLVFLWLAWGYEFWQECHKHERLSCYIILSGMCYQ